jgi:hypothetical protein
MHGQDLMPGLDERQKGGQGIGTFADGYGYGHGSNRPLFTDQGRQV